MTAPAPTQAPIVAPTAVQVAQQQNTQQRNVAGYDPIQAWKQADDARNQRISGTAQTVTAPQADTLTAGSAFQQRINAITNVGTQANQNSQDYAGRQQAAAQAKALAQWQAQQKKAYDDANASLQNQITQMQTQASRQGGLASPAAQQTGSYSGGGTQTVQAGNSTITLKAGQYNFGNAQDNQIAQWARDAGFGEDSLPMAVAVAHAESGGSPTAINDKNSNGSTDWGLMQINSVHSDLLSKYNKFDPIDNMKMAFQISNGGTDWKPWVTFQNGDVNKYLANTPTKVTGTQTFAGQVIKTQPQTSAAPDGSLRANVVGTAMKYLGTPYVFAGDSLTQGVDCSGLVHEVYKMLGIATPRTADDDSHPDQYKAEGAYGGATNINGYRTNIASLKPGDLVCWQGGWRGADLVGHVAIYAGNNQIIEAPDVGLTVRRRSLRANETDVGNGGRLIGIHLNLPGD